MSLIRNVAGAAVLMCLSGCSVTYFMRDLSPCTDDASCLAALESSIQTYWTLPACATPDMHATVDLSLPDKSAYIATRIVTSSGFQEFDQSVLAAIRQASSDIDLRGVNHHFRHQGRDHLLITLQASARAKAGGPACKPAFVLGEPPTGARRHMG